MSPLGVAPATTLSSITEPARSSSVSMPVVDRVMRTIASAPASARIVPRLLILSFYALELLTIAEAPALGEGALWARSRAGRRRPPSTDAPMLEQHLQQSSLGQNMYGAT